MNPPQEDGQGERAPAPILDRIGSFAHRFEFAIGTFGFLFGLALMTWDSLPWPGHGHSGADFLKLPEAMVWVFLVAAQFGFWFSALPFQWRWRCEVKEKFKVQITSELWGKRVLALFMFVAPAILLQRTLPLRLAHQLAKLIPVSLVAVLAAFVAVEGIWYVNLALGNRKWGRGTDRDDATHDKDQVESYLSLRESLGRFMTFLGAMISLATLARGASRHAFIASDLAAKVSSDAFPPEYVLLHGAYFTGLLALVYVPAYTRLAEAGKTILNSVFPITAPDVELSQLSQWQSNRKSLEELLQLQSGALDNLRASVTILAPLASAAISVLLGDKLLLGTK